MKKEVLPIIYDHIGGSSQILLNPFECAGDFCCVGNVDLDGEHLVMHYT